MRGPFASDTCRPSRSTDASWPLARSIATRVPLASSTTWPSIWRPLARPPSATMRGRIASGPFVIQVQVSMSWPCGSRAVRASASASRQSAGRARASVPRLPGAIDGAGSVPRATSVWPDVAASGGAKRSRRHSKETWPRSLKS